MPVIVFYKRFLILLFTIGGLFFSANANEPMQSALEQVYSALKAGDAKALSRTFDTNLSLSIKKEEGVYTKFQAELLLQDFFRLNKVSELKEDQKVNNSSNNFVVYRLISGTSVYRVFVKFSQNNRSAQVVELRIE